MVTRLVPLAITGVACRLARVTQPAAFSQGREAPAFAPLPDDRLSPDLFEGTTVQRGVSGALLDHYDVDWRALHLPPLQAERMHRMERVALATMAEALSDAGITQGQAGLDHTAVLLASSTFSSDPMTDHSRRVRRFELAAPVTAALARMDVAEAEEINEIIDHLFNIAAPPVDADSMRPSASIAAGRVANLFGTRGGHLAIDAGMASSMAALEEAARQLAEGHCDRVVVCAVSPIIAPTNLLAMAHAGFLGQDAPRPFASASTGTLPGEGVVTMVLERSDATAAKRVYGLIEAIGTATSPFRGGKQALSEAVQRAASDALQAWGGVPDQVYGVVSRALGVPQLDDEEAVGLARAYGASDRIGPLRLRSVVERFGFLHAASGMVALLDAVMSMHTRRWAGGPRGVAEVAPHALRVGGQPDALASSMRLGVSDAGLSSSSFHVIVGPAPPPAPRRAFRPVKKASSPIALVGAGLVVPGADDLDTFWSNILSGVNGLSELPSSRWSVDDMTGTSGELATLLKTRLAGVVDLPQLDPGKYGLPPSQNAELDPAILLAILSAERALDAVGELAKRWDPAKVDVLVGQLPYRWSEMELEKRALFAGHRQLAAEAMKEAGLDPDVVQRVMQEAARDFDARNPPFTPRSLEALTGSTVPSMVAHAFGFRGRAMSVDAACASSLAAIKIGARLLSMGTADAVLAGATAFNLFPEYYISLSMLGALSPHGAPPFDVGADGFVPSEGAGFVILRRLDDALAQNEPILSVLKGLGVSSDGRGVSVLAPHASGQITAMQRAFEEAELAPEAIDYLEAHGTGTLVGDAVELEAYGAVYGHRDASEPLTIGTVKSQLGHQSSAAGIIALIKTALALQARVLPPSNADTEVRPSLPFASQSFEFARVPREWTSTASHSRRAAVSAFGLGGVNYHALLEEPPEVAGSPSEEPRRGPPTFQPAGGTRADRFEVVTAPMALPHRAPAYPLAGKRVALVADPGELRDAFEQALGRRGANVLPMAPFDERASPQPADAAHRASRVGGVDVLLDLSAFGRATSRDAVCPDLEQLDRGFARMLEPLREVYPHFEKSAARCCYAVVTSLGGDMGFSGGGSGNLLGAAALGLCKGIRQELPGLLCKGIDFPAEVSPAHIAERALAEIEDGNDRVEVGYLDRRMVPLLVKSNHLADTVRVAPLVGDGVTLFTGGGRGVTFACAAALARRGERVVVCGRTARPGAHAWLTLPEAEFENDLRQRLYREHRQATPHATPASFDREVFGVMRRQRELERNLKRAEDQGLPLHYEVCDITDGAQTRALVEHVRSTHGQVRVVVHGAMVEWSRSLPRKDPRDVSRTLQTKVGGLLNLIEAMRDRPPETLLCFGSGAGRFGNRGQADYCAANQLMAAVLQRASQHGRAPARAMTLDWTAWEDIGAAAQDEAIAARVRETGVSSIKPNEGCFWFLSELALGRRGERLICAERLLNEWPGLAPGTDDGSAPAWALDDRGAPLVPGRWPMLDWVVERTDDRVVAERRVGIQRDRYLPHHRLHGAPIIPATFGCELLAEIGALGSPGFVVTSVRNVQIDVPVKLHHDRSILLQATAQVRAGTGPDRVVDAHSSSHLFLKGRLLQRDRLHHRGEVVLRPQDEPREVRHFEVPALPGAARSRSFFHLAKEPVGLGPTFCRAEWISVGDDDVTGQVRPPRMRDLFSFTSYPLFVLDPIVLDASFQIAANWDGYRQGYVSVPLGVEEIWVGRPRRRNEAVRVWARAVSVEDPDVRYDVITVGDDDEVLLQTRGLHLRRISKMDGHE